MAPRTASNHEAAPRPHPSRGPYLSVADAAAYLGVGRMTVYRLLERRELTPYEGPTPSGRGVKVAQHDLELLMRRRRRAS